MSNHVARVLLGLSVLALGAATTAAKSPPADRLGVVDTLIHEIQGNGLVSPLLGTRVTTQGVVTAVVGDGYVLQALPGDEDADPATSEGLFVFTGTADPSVAVGQQREVEGLVQEARVGDSPHQLTLTRLVDSQSLLLASGLPLPAPVAITAEELSPDADVDALERYEGMRVSVARLVVVGPTGASIDPTLLTATSDGVLHAVWGQTFGIDAEPPLREPGLSLLDAGTPPAGKNLAMHDANPEVLRVDSRAQPGAPLLDLGRNDRLRDAVGVLGYADARYSLLLDPVSTLVVQPRPRGGASARSPVELRMAWVDLAGLFDASDDPARNEPVPSPAGYQARLVRIADSVCRALNNPEVIAVNGAENLQVLQDLAAAMDANPSTLCPELRQYEAVLVDGVDPSGLDIGFLVAGALVDGVNPRITVLEVGTPAAGETSAHPAGGSEPLFTSPPLVARLRMTSSRGRTFEFTAVNARLHPLGGADSLLPGTNGWAAEGERIMTLRARQAARLAAWIEAWQQENPGEALAVLGGFDADPFNDGRVDVMGILTGNAAPADQSWVSLPSALTAPLTNLTLRVAAWSQYNTSERGDLRGLDHILVNAAMREAVGFIAGGARVNADFPTVDRFANVVGKYAFSPRDPRLARMAVKSFIDADTRVEMPFPDTLDPGNPGTLRLIVANGGPDFAPALELEVLSTLAPMRWGLSARWPGWNCGLTEPDAFGSRAVCRHDGLRELELNDFDLSVDSDPALAGARTTFVASVTGAHGDPDDTNNLKSHSMDFAIAEDLSVVVTALGESADLVPGGIAAFNVLVERSSTSPSQPVAINLDLDADPGDIRLDLLGTGVACDDGISTGTRRTRVTCSASDYAGARVASFGANFSIGLADGGRDVGVTASVSAAGADADPANNLASASLRVSDATDLQVTMPTASLPTANLTEQVSLSFSVRNGLRGAARNGRMQILVDLPPSAISAVEPRVHGPTPNLWSCLEPQADGAGSRIECTASSPLLQPEFPTHTYDFILYMAPPYRAGLAGYDVTTRITVSSDSDEQAPSDNSVEHTLAVDQSTDLTSRITSLQSSVIVPTPGRFQVFFSSIGANAPRNPVVILDVSGGITLDEILVTDSFQRPVTCMQEPVSPGGPSLVCLVDMTWRSLFVSFPTRTAMAGSTMVLQATVANDLPELNPDNNVSTGQMLVRGDADACLGVGCNKPLAYPNKLGGGGPNTLQYVVGNLGPGPAPAAALTIELDVPPQNLAARFDGQACLGAVDIGGGRSRVRCEIGTLIPIVTNRLVSIDVNTVGIVAGNVTGSIQITSDAPDPDANNNRIELDLPVAPVINLSTWVSVKQADYPSPAEFLVTTAVADPDSSVPSELNLYVYGPWQNGPVSFSGADWTCEPIYLEPSNVQSFHCARSQARLPGGTGRLVVKVPASQFVAIGQPIGVLVQHRFTLDALAVDRMRTDDWGEATMVVNGRSTQSVKDARKPTPAYGVPRAPGPSATRVPSRLESTR